MKPTKAQRLLEKAKDIQFLIVTDQPDSDTAEKMLSHPRAHLVEVSQAFISDVDAEKNSLIISNHDGEGNNLEIEPKNTVALIRGSSNTPNGLAIISALEQSGMFIVNDRLANDLARNKFSTNMILNKSRIPIPASVFVPDEAVLKDAVEKIGGEFPMLIKLLTGAEGVGVIKVDSFESLKSATQALWKQGGYLLLQKFYPIKYDTRALVLDGKVIGAMRRFIADGDFRSNVAQGGKYKPVKLTRDETQLVQQAAKSIGCYYCGVDFIEEDGNLHVLEVNSSPGSGAEYMTPEGKKISGDKLIEVVMDHLSDRSNWRRNRATTTGVLEVMEIDEIGKVKVKMDTGNESDNSLHADDIEVKGNKVTFTSVDGKKITKPVVDTQLIRAAHKTVERRPIVHFDVKFNGIKLKDVAFNLTNRGSNDHPVLVGNKFLVEFNFKVDPAHTFLLGESTRSNRLRNLVKK